MKLLLLLLFPCFLFSQFVPRQIFRGKIVSDTMAVERVTITNISSNIVAITDDFGKFSIYAKAKDTLVISSVAFDTVRLIVEESDFEFEVLKIKLDVSVNVLDEVIIKPIKLTGDLASDSKKIKTIDVPLLKGEKLEPRDYEISSTTKPVNSVNGNVDKSLGGINFIAIGELLFNAIFKPKPKKDKSNNKRTFVIFADVVKEKFTYHFFSQTLKLKNEEIPLFLNFADTNEVSENKLLKYENEVLLIEYLIKKSEEFRKI